MDKPDYISWCAETEHYKNELDLRNAGSAIGLVAMAVTAIGVILHLLGVS